MSPSDDKADTQPRLDDTAPSLPVVKKQRFWRLTWTFSRAEKIALFAAGLIWTLAIWTALIIVIILDGETMWAWLVNEPSTVQAAPLTPPLTIDDWLAQPTIAAPPTATATLVLNPASSETPSPKPTAILTSSSTMTPTQIATITSPAPAVPPPAATVEPLLPVETADPATPVPPTRTQAEVAAITIPQPEAPLEIAVAAQSITAIPATPVPWPPPSDPPLPLTARQEAAMPSRIIIDSVGIDTPVIPVGWYITEQDSRLISTWEVAEYAAGWHQNSALPGEPGNIVISGHSNVSGEVFRHLAEVNKGDRIILYAGSQAFAYEVTTTTVVKEAGEPLAVREQNAQWIAPTDDDRLTLVTCWPYPYSTHRFIAVARPVR